MENSFEDREGIPNIETISGEVLINLIYKGENLPQDSRFGEKIVGLAGLEESPYEPNTLWIKFVSVDPEFQGRGYASRLVTEVFRFAKDGGKSLVSSYFTDEGVKLKPVIERLAEETGVVVRDNKS